MFGVEIAYAAEQAAEHGAEEAAGLAGSLGAVYPNPADIWPTWIAFLILFFLLYKFALPSITGMLDKRADTIKESLERAEDTKVEAERLLEEYKEQMAEARGEAGKVIEQGRKVAESMKEEIVAKANEEAAGIVAKAHEAMETEKQAADDEAKWAREAFGSSQGPGRSVVGATPLQAPPRRVGSKVLPTAKRSLPDGAAGPE